ncbi:MAG: hypothetical protein H0W83_16940 [Planctomycetes bacterium]|nr:hypothetical protein [Planctomycetota bacterium]
MPFALLYIDERFQAIYRGWWKALLATANPYTGLTIADDPAVAIAELVNEDSCLFWTFTPYKAIPAEVMAQFEQRFARSLTKPGSSVAEVLAAWGGAPVQGDDAANGRIGLLPMWDLTQRKDARAQANARFLAELQREFYAGTRDYLREKLHFRGSVCGSNWITADARLLGPLDKWSVATCDMMDHHGYYGGPHVGSDRVGYSVNAGERYDDACALRFDPTEAEAKGRSPALPIMDITYDGKPAIISEIGWTQPNRFRADMPLIAAAYGALQGTDGFCFFATSSRTWDQTIGKFGIHDPAIMGQFPAAALMYRTGMVAPGDPVVSVHLALADLFALKGSPVVAAASLDDLRARDVPTGATVAAAAVTAIDPLAYLVGRVEVAVGEAAAPAIIADLAKRIDRAAGVVTSTTAQLAWNHQRGLVTIDTPMAQGATGFLAQAPIALGCVRVAAGFEYGAVVVVALDGRPLTQSKRMLLQVMSEESNFGWSAPGTGLRAIASIGGPPVVVRAFSGSVSLGRADAAALAVTPLDANGYPDTSAAGAGHANAITLLPGTMYYLIGE